MATFLISYDLNQPGQDYSNLYAAIDRLASAWWHHLDSTWIIEHAGPASNIIDELLPCVDRSDRLLVVELNGSGAWFGFDQQGSNWLSGIFRSLPLPYQRLPNIQLEYLRRNS